MAKVKVKTPQGQIITVDESRPGLFGEIGYEYVNDNNLGYSNPDPEEQAGIDNENNPPTTTTTPPATTTTQPPVDTLPPDDPSNKFNTQTGKLNPNYNGGDDTGFTSVGDDNMDQILEQINTIINDKLSAGKTVNKDIDFDDPAVMEQFYDQAEAELGPYYTKLFGDAKEDVYSYLETSKKQYELKTKQMAEEAKRSLETQRATSASAGTLYSGARNLGEQDWASNVNRGLESLYNTQASDVRGVIRDYTSKYGTDQRLTTPVNQYGLSNVGKGNQYTRQSSVLTPDSGITGSEEFKARINKEKYAKNAATGRSLWENINI